jgi:predicted dehydrogenase
MTIEGSARAAAAPRRIRLGMVGGGQGAFIGAVHRIAARLDDCYELVAGALSSQAERAAASAAALHIAPERAYADFRAMASAEATREDGIDVVSIVTPNHLHAPIASAFLDAGIDVICDKPLCTSLSDALALVDKVRGSGRLFALTHNYSGYPMVRQAREMVAAGELGEIRLVHAEYVQDWLSTELEATGQKQAAWRTDPAQSGAGGALGDIGTHAEHLGRFISGLELSTVSADLQSFVKGRKLDDNDNVLMRWKGGAKGMIWASQVAPGNENGLMLRVYGSKAGLYWRQEQPNSLWFSVLGQPPILINRAAPGSNADAGRVTRVPSGHPEGYLEGFANIYSEVARAIRAARSGKKPDPAVLFPTVEDGLAGMEFVEACVASSKKGGVWTKV